jgi:hypothetical protein
MSIFQGISLYDKSGNGITSDTRGSAQPLAVEILDASGNQITSFGGGSQFAMGSAQSSSALGTIALGYDGANVRGLSVTSGGVLNVALTSTTITGTVAVTQSTSPWVVAGNVASGASDSGNPVKTGAVFNTTQPTVTNGQRVDSQATARGALIVATGVDTFTVAISGTPTVNQGTSPWITKDQADGTVGSAAPTIAQLSGGSDGTNLRALNVSTSGTTLVQDAVDAEASSINFFATNSAAAGVSVASGSYVPVLSIRSNSSSKIFRLRGIDVMSLNGAASAFQLIRNTTLTGASFATVTGTNMQSDTAATSLSGGTVVDCGFVAEQKARDKSITIYIAAGAPGDILTLAFNPSSGSATVGAAFQWSEQSAAL